MKRAAFAAVAFLALVGVGLWRLTTGRTLSTEEARFIGTWVGAESADKGRLVVKTDGTAMLYSRATNGEASNWVTPERWEMRSPLLGTWKAVDGVRADGTKLTILAIRFTETPDWGAGRTLILDGDTALIGPPASRFIRGDRPPTTVSAGDHRFAYEYADKYCAGQEFAACIRPLQSAVAVQAGNQSSEPSNPDLQAWDGTFNGFTGSNGYSLRVLGRVMKFSMVNPYAASGHIEEVIDCEGRWEAPSDRASFALRVKMACTKGPAQLTPFLTYNADLDAWLMTPNTGAPIKLSRTARGPSM